MIEILDEPEINKKTTIVFSILSLVFSYITTILGIALFFVAPSDTDSMDKPMFRIVMYSIDITSLTGFIFSIISIKKKENSKIKIIAAILNTIFFIIFWGLIIGSIVTNNL